LTDKLVSLALLAQPDDMADAAQYLGKLSGYEHHSILLYHKACHLAAAVSCVPAVLVSVCV